MYEDSELSISLQEQYAMPQAFRLALLGILGSSLGTVCLPCFHQPINSSFIFIWGAHDQTTDHVISQLTL